MRNAGGAIPVSDAKTCPVCWYDTTGAGGERCPECGTLFIEFWPIRVRRVGHSRFIERAGYVAGVYPLACVAAAHVLFWLAWLSLGRSPTYGDVGSVQAPFIAANAPGILRIVAWGIVPSLWAVVMLVVWLGIRASKRYSEWDRPLRVMLVSLFACLASVLFLWLDPARSIWWYID